MASSETRNPVDLPVLSAIANRWSPYRFADQAVEDEKIRRVLEAARWAASSFNDQPWYFIVARRRDEPEFQTMLECLMEANQAWASRAGVLMLTCIRTTFQYNGKPNRVALHDLGQASGYLALQATEMGLQVHQMAGINLSVVRQKYELPEGVEPQTAIAIGYPDTTAPADEQNQQWADRENGARKRNPLSAQVFTGKFGQSSPFVD
ncbi:malonic semialdehyde reductase [Crateriforma conspicua]|uniref:Malonic semialdehyde reductase n=1 Tax=Crateriforma conspicua TaxID=2527996 RepID=A0A5C6FWM1_9PLAN|nr:nitroreductase family protein [Crateriforma conspicua]TWU67552.1 malonic semialdehyde reductase [Crateriforma conspicua]